MIRIRERIRLFPASHNEFFNNASNLRYFKIKMEMHLVLLKLAGTYLHALWEKTFFLNNLFKGIYKTQRFRFGSYSTRNIMSILGIVIKLDIKWRGVSNFELHTWSLFYFLYRTTWLLFMSPSGNGALDIITDADAVVSNNAVSCKWLGVSATHVSGILSTTAMKWWEVNIQCHMLNIISEVLLTIIIMIFVILM